MLSGSGQSAPAGAAFADDLVVVVRDTYGNVVPNVFASFAAQAGLTGASAQLSGATASTMATGQASVHAVANGTVGSFTVSSTVGGATVAFNLTNRVGHPNTIVASFSSTPELRLGVPEL